MKLADSKLCVECDEVVAAVANACPSCTCTHFLMLSRVIMPLPERREINLVRRITEIEEKL